MNKSLLCFICPASFGLALYAGTLFGKTSRAPLLPAADEKQPKRLSGTLPTGSAHSKKVKSNRRSKGSGSSTNSSIVQEKNSLARMKDLISKVGSMSEPALKELLHQYFTNDISQLDQLETNIIIDALLAASASHVDALNYLLETYGPVQPYGPRRQEFLSYALSALGMRDSEATLEWISTVPLDGSNHINMQRCLLRGIAKVDPMQAMRITDDLFPTEPQSTLCLTIIKDLAALPLETTWDWIEKHSGRHYLPNAIKKLPAESLHEVAQRLKSVEDPHRRSAANRVLAGTWSKSDPAATMKWIEKLPLKEGSDLTYHALKHFNHLEPRKLYDWALRFQDDLTFKRNLHGRLLTILAKQEPTRAATLFKDYKGNNRSYYRDLIHSAWAETDPNAAKLFLEADKKRNKS